MTDPFSTRGVPSRQSLAQSKTLLITRYRIGQDILPFDDDDIAHFDLTGHNNPP